ncbi:ATP-grasp domain-containing protein [Pantoea stewartii subsp. indologenes]|uniref:ATP-grasp domain-containing protein n=1 Tax=Pantoea stewartii TaxID=66269 RepID=UPI003FA4A949
MNILILGSNFSPVHRKLRALEHRLHIIPDPNRKLHISDNDLYASVQFVQDDIEVETLAERICRDRTFFNIDRVMAFNEKWQLVAARVAALIGLPVITDPNLVSRTLDKHSMREHLQQAGLPTVKFAKIMQPSELYNALETVGYPAILKPLKGEASRGIALIRNEDDLQECVLRLTEQVTETFLLESFIQGEEYSVEAISYHHQHHILAITKKYKNNNFVEIGHVLPAHLTPEREKEIKEYIYHFLDIMGFDNTASHTEIILTKDGPVVIESHTRPGGDNIYRLLEFSTGIDLMNLVAKINTDSLEDIDLHKTTSPCFSAIWYLCLEKNDGLIFDEVTGLNDAKSLDNIKEINVLIKPGEVVRPVKNSFDRSAFAIATSVTAEEAISSVRNALSHLKFHYQQTRTVR